ncbi:hypothetical protein BASA81_005047 [Batrachochytrium salamandrivorans]|nr:hypothetical protein BASA81_005047 [Batrachochytrium salamandrivorans]
MSVFCAVYSNIPVYETVRRNVVVMRRISDNQLNATQILKLAGFPKSQRTKVLESEVHIGEHQKVQGGYGKYQGTCVAVIAMTQDHSQRRLVPCSSILVKGSFEAGKELALRFNVYDLIEPLLLFDPSTDTVFKRASYTKVAPTIVVTETKRRGRPPKHPTVQPTSSPAPAATPPKSAKSTPGKSRGGSGRRSRALLPRSHTSSRSLENDSTTALSPLDASGRDIDRKLSNDVVDSSTSLSMSSPSMDGSYEDTSYEQSHGSVVSTSSNDQATFPETVDEDQDASLSKNANGPPIKSENHSSQGGLGLTNIKEVSSSAATPKNVQPNEKSRVSAAEPSSSKRGPKSTKKPPSTPADSPTFVKPPRAPYGSRTRGKAWSGVGRKPRSRAGISEVEKSGQTTGDVNSPASPGVPVDHPVCEEDYLSLTTFKEFKLAPLSKSAQAASLAERRRQILLGIYVNGDDFVTDTFQYLRDLQCSSGMMWRWSWMNKEVAHFIGLPCVDELKQLAG